MEYFINEKVDKILLYEAYKAFYDKEPNFKEENRRNITIEMQAMAYLLEQYRIVIGNYRFAYSELTDLYMPISMELQDLLVSKMLNHENKEFALDFIILKEELKFKITLVGSTVMAKISEKEDPLEALRLLCSIYYTSKSIRPNATDDKIIEYNKCALEDVTEARELNDSLTLDLSLDRVNGYPGL